MNDNAKSGFSAIRQRLIREQHAAIVIEANLDRPPADHAIRRIADLERAIVALEAIIDEEPSH